MKTTTLLIALIAGTTGVAAGVSFATATSPVKAESEPEIIMRYERYYDVPISFSDQDKIKDICSEYNVDEALVYAVIAHESDFQEDLIDGDDWGLMQINKVNHAEMIEKLGVTHFLNVEQNVRCGVYMLSQLQSKYESTTDVLMAYNLGETGAKRKWEQGITHTDYSDTVLTNYEYIKNGGRYLCHKE